MSNKDNVPTYKKVAVSDLIPYARNSRTHSEPQIGKIAASIREFGFLNPVIIDAQNGIIAGHGRVMAAQKLGLTEIPVIEASHLTDAQRRAYIIADNRLALDAGWDEEMLRVELADLEEMGLDLALTGFDSDEIADIFADDKAVSEDNPYTNTVKAPVYEPKGEKPQLSEMFDRAKTEALLASIHEADLPDDLRLFLVSAAHRHTEFNYEQIAEFYCHADSDVQKLIEDSALVIIDFQKAIEMSYVILNENMKQTYSEEYPENVH